MIIVLCVISWIVCAIIVAFLGSKIEKEPIEDYAPALFLWPIGLIILICEACVMCVNYIRGGKERNEKLRLHKRNEIESILKEI